MPAIPNLRPIRCRSAGSSGTVTMSLRPTRLWRSVQHRIAWLSTTRANARAGLVADVLASCALLYAGFAARRRRFCRCAGNSGLARPRPVQLRRILLSTAGCSTVRCSCSNRATASTTSSRRRTTRCRSSCRRSSRWLLVGHPERRSAGIGCLAVHRRHGRRLCRVRPDPLGFPQRTFPPPVGQALGRRASHPPLSPGSNFGVTTPLWDIVLKHPLPIRGRNRLATVTRGVESRARRQRSATARRVGRLLIVVMAIAATVIVPICSVAATRCPQRCTFPYKDTLAILALIVGELVLPHAQAATVAAPIRRAREPARSLGISLATDFAFMTTPGGVGGYAASVYYLRRAGASASGAAAITAADQGMDVLFFVVALPLAAFGLLCPMRSVRSLQHGRTVATSAADRAGGAVAWLARGRLAMVGSDRFRSGSRWPRLRACATRRPISCKIACRRATGARGRPAVSFRHLRR